MTILPISWCIYIYDVQLVKWVVQVFSHTALVSISANWSSDLTNGIWIILASRFYLIKCRSSFTCLVRSSWMGLWEISIATLLLQKRFILVIGGKPFSIIGLLSYRSLQRPSTIPRSSAWTMHQLTHYTYSICNDRPYVWEINKFSHQSLITSLVCWHLVWIFSKLVILNYWRVCMFTF